MPDNLRLSLQDAAILGLLSLRVKLGSLREGGVLA